MSNVKAVFGQKFVLSKTGQMKIFVGKGCKVKTLVLRLPNGTSLHETASLDVFCVKIRAGVFGVDDLKTPPHTHKNEKVPSKKYVARSRACAETKPLIPLDEILQDDRCPRHNHLCKFW